MIFKPSEEFYISAKATHYLQTRYVSMAIEATIFSVPVRTLRFGRSSSILKEKIVTSERHHIIERLPKRRASNVIVTVCRRLLNMHSKMFVKKNGTILLQYIKTLTL